MGALSFLNGSLESVVFFLKNKYYFKDIFVYQKLLFLFLFHFFPWKDMFQLNLSSVGWGWDLFFNQKVFDVKYTGEVPRCAQKTLCGKVSDRRSELEDSQNQAAFRPLP